MRRRRHAFTLVELLVVIGIIALLIAVLMPALTQARKAAQAVACASNIRQVALGTISYTIDNRGRFPYAAWAPSGFVPPQYSWTDLIDRYLNGRLTQSELDTGLLNTSFVSHPASYYVLSVLICPADPTTDAAVGGAPTVGVPHMTYAISQTIGGTVSYSSTPPVAVTMSQVKSSSRVLLIVESPNPTSARGRLEGAYCQMPALQSAYLYGGPTFNPFTQAIFPPATNVGLHPGDTFNYAYCDGHVERLYPTDSDGFYYAGGARGICSGLYWNNYIIPRGGWALDGNP